MPVDVCQGRVSSTMTSEQSTGTSGYATLLSRKGTLHSVEPNVHNTLVKEDVLNKARIEMCRTEFSALFVSTRSAESFLNLAKLSGLVQVASRNARMQAESSKVSEDRLKSCEVTNDSLLCGLSFNSSPSYDFSQNFSQLTEDSSKSNETSSPSFSVPRMSSLPLAHSASPVSIENSSHSYNFSRTYLLLAEDSPEGEDNLIKSEEIGSANNSKESYSFSSECSEEESQVVEHVGYVDVSETNITCRIAVTTEVDPATLAHVDHVQLSSSYSRQLAVTDLVVIMVDQEDREVCRGLVKYISRYWAGFFPALLVEVSREEERGDTLVDTLSEVFCSVERLGVQGVEEGGGKIFSTIARMLSMKRVAGIE